jgi:signal peptidase I
LHANLFLTHTETRETLDYRSDFRPTTRSHLEFLPQHLFETIHQAAHSIVNLGMVILSALMIWKGLIVVTGGEAPVVVVLSGSMETAFFRGDILFLMGTRPEQAPLHSGDIVVFKVKGRDIPIVHRLMEIHEKPNGKVRILTKGDNNPVDDRGLYHAGQLWLSQSDVVGRATGFLPYVGMVTIVLTEYPYLKYLLVGLMCIFVLTGREEE